MYFLPDDDDESDRTVTDDKQVDLSQLSDEGFEVSLILSDNQGSLDVQNEETVIGKLEVSLYFTCFFAFEMFIGRNELVVQIQTFPHNEYVK